MNTKNKIIIWDLFGGGCNSISRAIKKFKLDNLYYVFTFDVVATHKKSKRGQINCDFQKYIKIDLSQNNIINIFETMISQKIIIKPDIITSSTLCQSFSKVLSMTGGGTCFWKQSIKGDKTSPLIERSIEEFNFLKSGFTKNLNADKQLFIKRLGQKCVDNTVHLIRYYNPKFWFIENPSSSMIFQYLKYNLKLNGFLNVACFGSYNYPQNKSGGFYSNYEFKLSKEKKAATYETQWEPISKKYYFSWIKNVNSKAKLGSSKDKRHVKGEKIFQSRSKDGTLCRCKRPEHCKNSCRWNYFRRWYVDIGFNIGDKGHSSLKKTTMTLGKLTKGKYQLKTKGDFSTEQIGEANKTSHIPEKVIKEILQAFK